jgi:hypothetical protein
MRPKFITRTIRLIGTVQRDTAIALLSNAPLDGESPLEVIVREEKKTRKPDQNAAMWSGPLRDIAEQAWVDGRQYSAPVWHEWAKREYLPEDDDPELPELTKDGYRKWDVTPKGDRVLIGSTTQLTVKGMAQYMRQVEAYGASLGVQFHAAPMRDAA